MAGTENQKLKLLWIYDYLKTHTDSENGVSVNNIIDFLNSKGIVAERKSVYSDIAILKEFGLHIETKTGVGTKYMLVSRTFEIAELKLLADAVCSSKFITKRKSLSLIQKLETLTSKNYAKTLSRKLVVEGQVKSMNESILYNVDAIYSAILDNKKLLFYYFDYDDVKTRVFRHQKAEYCVSPLSLLYSDSNYYLVCYSEKHEGIINYRVDRMTSVKPSKQAIESNSKIRNFNPSSYQNTKFSMFGGEITTVTLEFDKSLSNIAVDRFGTDLIFRKTENGTFLIDVAVELSPTFFSWLFMFTNKVAIVSPDTVIKRYKQHLSDTISKYN